MSTVYKLPYTGNEIKEKIGQVDKNTTAIGQLSQQIDNLKGWCPFEIKCTYNPKWYIDSSGIWQRNELFNVSDPIPVNEGMKLRYKHTFGNSYITDLTFTNDDDSEDGTYRPNSNFHIQRINTSNNEDIRVDVPNGAKYVFVCWQTDKDTLDTISLSFDVLDYLDKINAKIPEPKTEEIDFNLPKKLYAVKGEELNIYFDNIVKGNIEDYVVNVDCGVGQQLDRCFRLTPTEVGTHNISITISNGDSSVTKTSTIYVTNASTENERNVKVLVIGDSTTNGGVPIRLLCENATDKRVSVSALGTRGDGRYKHEGRSGWTANYYMNVQTDGTYTNAFYNPNTKTFDFAYYLAQNNIENPDMVIFNLGINDVFSCVDDTTLESTITEFVAYYNTMIGSIKSVVPNVKIGVCLTIPPNKSQDSFGKSYGCRQTRDRYKYNNFELVKRIISEFEDRENENIYLMPINTNLDTVYNMGLETIQVNKRNSKTYESAIAYGSVHPDTSGLWQVVDVYWYVINAIF